MDVLNTVGLVAGGVGIFLLAMRLMTDGLKLAGGGALRTLLRRSTATRLRGFGVGVLVTALVQSSSAVTVALIGFVNAGFLNLFQAIGVIYGSNVGTTMTAWLVALLGFKIKIEAFAFPLVGIGMPLWFLRPGSRHGAIGQAVAGFGLFFVGIDTLRTGFEAVAPTFNLEIVANYGIPGVILLVGVGFLMTLLMQSSSAAIALTLTAAVGGVIAIPSAAAVVIGANIGTTSTAFLATLDSTPNAKRVAAAHILFNVLTGAVALVLLPLLIAIVRWTGELLGMEETPAVALALFHTTFNLLGVALMWPMTRRMTAWLEQQFRTTFEDERHTKYLDRSATGAPTAAIHALVLEVGRVGTLAQCVVTDALAGGTEAARRVHIRREAIEHLTHRIAEFASAVGKERLAAEVADALPQTVRIAQYFAETAELASSFVDVRKDLGTIQDRDLVVELDGLFEAVTVWVNAAEPGTPSFSADAYGEQLDTLLEDYHQIKDHVVRAGVARDIEVHALGHLLEHLSTLNRVLKRQFKAVRLLTDLSAALAEDHAASGAPPREDGEATPSTNGPVQEPATAPVQISPAAQDTTP